MKLGLLWVPCSTCMNLGLGMQQGKAPSSFAPFCWHDAEHKMGKNQHHRHCCNSQTWGRGRISPWPLWVCDVGQALRSDPSPSPSLYPAPLGGFTKMLLCSCWHTRIRIFQHLFFSVFLFTISKESILTINKRLLILLSSALPILYHKTVIISLCTVIALSFFMKMTMVSSWSLSSSDFFSVTNNCPPNDGRKLGLVFLLLEGEHKQWHTLNIGIATQGLSQTSYTHHTEAFISQLFLHCYTHTHNAGKHPVLNADLAKITAAFIRRWLPDCPLTPGIQSKYHRSTLTLPQPPQPRAHIACRRQASQWGFKY